MCTPSFLQWQTLARGMQTGHGAEDPCIIILWGKAHLGDLLGKAGADELHIQKEKCLSCHVQARGARV